MTGQCASRWAGRVGSAVAVAWLLSYPPTTSTCTGEINGFSRGHPFNGVEVSQRSGKRDLHRRRLPALLTVRVAGHCAAFHFRVVTETGDQTITIEPIYIMTFDDQARITSIRAFWSEDDVSFR
ncbi:hypothetical protein [Rhodococcus sp. 1168]|uniref:hypothetical protein n=1 Tax=Rhodococcus sp. 1168 TaxID=2018041 RepID=UPI0026B30311